MRLTRRATLFVALAGLAGLGRAAARPMRIVSLNPCLDAILLSLVERERIAAVSHYARDPHTTTTAEIARTLPITYETAEEIVALKPDLVLASQHTALATRAALARLGIPFALFGVPQSVAESQAEVREIGRLTGREAEAERLNAAIDAAIADAAPPSGTVPIEALIFQARGFAAGSGTLLDEMMTRCGLENVAARYGISWWGNVALERLVADPPQLLLAGSVSAGAPSWAERVLSHPALKAVEGRMARMDFPEALLYCGGPVLLKTAAALKAARLAYLDLRR